MNRRRFLALSALPTVMMLTADNMRKRKNDVLVKMKIYVRAGFLDSNLTVPTINELVAGMDGWELYSWNCSADDFDVAIVGKKMPIEEAHQLYEDAHAGRTVGPFRAVISMDVKRTES